MAIQTGCLCGLHGEQSLAEFNRCDMLVFNKKIIWNVLKAMISTKNKLKWSFHCFLTFCCLPKYIGMNERFLFTSCSILIAISQVLIEIDNEEHVCHVLVCILGN